MIEGKLHGGFNAGLNFRHAINLSSVAPLLLTEFLVAVILASPVARAGQAKEPPGSTTTNAVAEVGTNPENLKKQTHIVLATNLPAAAEQGLRTNKPPKTFGWNSHWDGWDGLYLRLSSKQPLGGTFDVRTNRYGFQLSETQMEGKIGAKLAVDAAGFVVGKQFTDFDGGVEVRRARVYAKGDCLLLLPVSYELEIGYIPGSFYIENSFLEFHRLGILDFLGTLKIGQYQVPMSMVNYASSRDMVLMEPAAPVAALAPGVNAGIQVGQPVLGQRMTWAMGLFTDGVGVGSDFGEATKDFGRVVGRLTGLPIFKCDPEHPESQRLLHLGLSGSAVYAGQSTVQYRSRPESRLAPYVVDTGKIDARGAYTFGAEAAWVDGPLSIGGELLHSWVPETTGQQLDFGGFYGSASWFLTGESRPYDLTKGTFGRVIPKRNFNFGHGGWGALEVAGRYSYVNLNSGNIEGGRMSMVMAGVNWYLHSHLKWRFDYGVGHVSEHNPEGFMNIFQTRIEVDF